MIIKQEKMRIIVIGKTYRLMMIKIIAKLIMIVESKNKSTRIIQVLILINNNSLCSPSHNKSKQSSKHLIVIEQTKNK